MAFRYNLENHGLNPLAYNHPELERHTQTWQRGNSAHKIKRAVSDASGVSFHVKTLSGDCTLLKGTLYKTGEARESWGLNILSKGTASLWQFLGMLEAILCPLSFHCKLSALRRGMSLPNGPFLVFAEQLTWCSVKLTKSILHTMPLNHACA